MIIKLNGLLIPLNPFVRNIIRKSVLAMISTLKGVEIEGDEDVEIHVKKSEGDSDMHAVSYSNISFDEEISEETT